VIFGVFGGAVCSCAETLQQNKEITNAVIIRLLLFISSSYFNEWIDAAS
jgi:hypothetical protein